VSTGRRVSVDSQGLAVVYGWHGKDNEGLIKVLILPLHIFSETRVERVIVKEACA
jgi:hypothetical protein